MLSDLGSVVVGVEACRARLAGGETAWQEYLYLSGRDTVDSARDMAIIIVVVQIGVGLGRESTGSSVQVGGYECDGDEACV